MRDKVNGVLPLLPKTIQQPRVDRFDPDAAPVLSLALSANKPVRDITEYADKVLRRQLESVNGVGQVLVLGGRQRQINVWLDADRLRAYNLTVNDVARALQAQNIEIPGGRVDQGPQSLTLRTRGRVQSVAEFNDIVIREKNGHPVRVSEVARVEDGEADPDTTANVNGAGTVLLQVRRQSGTNTVEVVKEVKTRLNDLKATLPPGYSVRQVRDTSEFIEASIHNVEEHLIVGSILAALVVLLFLTNLRSTIIAAIAIPTSIIATFGLLWYMGFTLNMMTMLALTLSVGIVIDDAIVVLENIYRFIEEKHEDQFQAAVEATQGDRPRRAGDDAVARRDLRAGRLHGRHRRPLHEELRPDDGVRDHGVAARQLHADADAVGALAEGRRRTARTGTRRRTRGSSTRSTRSTRGCSSGRWRTAGGRRRLAVLVLLSSVPLFMIANKNFMPHDDQSEFEVNLRAPEGTSLEATEVLTNRMANAVRQRLPEVDYTLVTIGGDPAKTRNLGTIYVRLKPIEKRARDQFAVMDVIRKDPAAADGEPADVGAAGRDHRRRRRAERRRPVRDQRAGPEEARGARPGSCVAMKTLPGVVDVDTSLNVGKPELSVQVDRPKGGRPRRADRRRRRSAAACWSAAIR